MKKVAKKMVILTMLLSGTQVINLPFINLTIFQISLIIATILSFFAIISERYISKGRYLLFSIIFFISSFIAYYTSIYPSWAKSYLLLGIMTAILVFIIPILFDKSDFVLLEKALIRSQYIVFPFSLYSIYMFYFKGGIPNHINLILGMSMDLDTSTLLRAQAASQIRLTLPYSTPPVLSIVMSMCIIILVVDKTIFKDWIRYSLIIVFAIILILTGSRTGIIGLFLVLILKPFIEKKGSWIVSKKIIAVIGAAIIGLLFLIPRLLTSEYFQKLIYRFTKINFESLMTDRHFLVPLDGILLWINSFENFFVGIGFGSSYYLDGAHTYLPPYFLNSFITLLAERGVFGLILVCMLIRLAIRLMKRINYLGNTERGLSYCLLTGLVSCMFYEGLNCYFLIYVLAICFLLDSVLDKNSKSTSN